MKTEKPLVLFINNIAPLYRKNVWTKYLQSDKMEVHFFLGPEKHKGIQTIDFNQGALKAFAHRIHFIRNTYVLQKYIVWQWLNLYPWIKKKPKTIVFLGEFNILSNWLYTLIAKIKGIPVVYKGHGMYGNEKGLKLFLRKTFLKMADKHLVYERHAKNILIQQGIAAKKIHILFNSLDYDTQVKLRPQLANGSKKELLSFFKNPEAALLLFIGRLTKVKKLELVLLAAEILQKNNIPVNVLLVGTGPEKAALEELAQQILPQGSCHFYGESYDEALNSKLIALADLCVAPGNVGLTAIHSLSYGTPVCTHSNLTEQMPEAEAITHGENGVLFAQDDVHSLANAIEGWLTTQLDRELIREKCFAVIDGYYNPYYQAKVLENLVAGNRPML